MKLGLHAAGSAMCSVLAWEFNAMDRRCRQPLENASAEKAKELLKRKKEAEEADWDHQRKRVFTEK